MPGPDHTGEPPAPADAAAVPALAGDVDVAALYRRVEAVLLEGPRQYTPVQVAQRADVSREQARALWRALGFASAEDDDAVYTDLDVGALETVHQLQAIGFEDEQTVLAMSRLFGQTFSRLASWQGQLVLEMLATRPEVLESEESLTELMDELAPLLAKLQDYVWRRQLVAFFGRAAARAAGETATALSTELAVGFVDMSGFTTLTRRATELELRELLDAFEALATEIVGAHGGRVVKTIGDEVLFQAEDAPAAAAIALEMIEAAQHDERLPELRAGVAIGPVVSRLGDVYGSTVNIASRLTSIGRPGWVLVDRAMREALRDDQRFELRSRRPESVRGFHHLHPWRLRRAPH